jgi:hypothetical protein
MSPGPQGAPHLLGPLIVGATGLAAGGTEDGHALHLGERLEPLHELAHDAEDPPGVLDGEVEHRVAAWLQDQSFQ